MIFDLNKQEVWGMKQRHSLVHCQYQITMPPDGNIGDAQLEIMPRGTKKKTDFVFREIEVYGKLTELVRKANREIIERSLPSSYILNLATQVIGIYRDLCKISLGIEEELPF